MEIKKNLQMKISFGQSVVLICACILFLGLVFFAPHGKNLTADLLTPTDSALPFMCTEVISASSSDASVNNPGNGNNGISLWYGIGNVMPYDYLGPTGEEMGYLDNDNVFEQRYVGTTEDVLGVGGADDIGEQVLTVTCDTGTIGIYTPELDNVNTNMRLYVAQDGSTYHSITNHDYSSWPDGPDLTWEEALVPEHLAQASPTYEADCYNYSEVTYSDWICGDSHTQQRTKTTVGKSYNEFTQACDLDASDVIWESISCEGDELCESGACTAPTFVSVNGDYTASTSGFGVYSFNTIQSAIDTVPSGGTVYVFSGTYYENLVIDKDLTLEGALDAPTVIDGAGADTVIYVRGADNTISNLTIQNSSRASGDTNNAGIQANLLPDTVNLTIEDCIIYGNGYGILLGDTAYGTATIQNNMIFWNSFDGIKNDGFMTSYYYNNTIADNGLDGYRDSIAAGYQIFKNNIIAYNGEYGLNPHAYSILSLTYDDVWENADGNYYETDDSGLSVVFTPDPGTGEISADPLFVDSDNGDYNIQLSSPCQNAGEGGVDMGASLTVGTVDTSFKPVPEGETTFTFTDSGSGSVLAGLSFDLDLSASNSDGLDALYWRITNADFFDTFDDSRSENCESATTCEYSTPISMGITDSYDFEAKAIDTNGNETFAYLTVSVTGCTTDEECGGEEWFGDTMCGNYNGSSWIYQYHKDMTCSSSGACGGATGAGTDPKTECPNYCEVNSTTSEAECVDELSDDSSTETVSTTTTETETGTVTTTTSSTSTGTTTVVETESDDGSTITVTTTETVTETGEMVIVTTTETATETGTITTTTTEAVETGTGVIVEQPPYYDHYDDLHEVYGENIASQIEGLILEDLIDEIVSQVTTTLMEEVVQYIDYKVVGTIMTNFEDFGDEGDELLVNNNMILEQLTAIKIADLETQVEELEGQVEDLEEELERLAELQEEFEYGVAVLNEDLAYEIADAWDDVQDVFDTGPTASRVEAAIERLETLQEEAEMDKYENGYGYTDVPYIFDTEYDEGAHWYAESVIGVTQDGLTSGYKDTEGNLTYEFGVANNLLRAEVMKVSLLLFDYEVAEEGENWQDVYVEKSSEVGLGIAAQVPLEAVTRGEMMNLIYELGLQAGVMSEPANYVHYLNDVSEEDEYWPAFQVLYEAGIITGQGGTHADLYSELNRAEMAKIIYTARTWMEEDEEEVEEVSVEPITFFGRIGEFFKELFS